MGNIGAHALAVVISFFIITAMHIVLGELAPKSSRSSAASAPPS